MPGLSIEIFFSNGTKSIRILMETLIDTQRKNYSKNSLMSFNDAGKDVNGSETNFQVRNHKCIFFLNSHQGWDSIQTMGVQWLCLKIFLMKHYLNITAHYYLYLLSKIQSDLLQRRGEDHEPVVPSGTIPPLNI